MDSKKAKIGLVTVTFNSAEVIDDFMKSVFKQDFDNFKLYIVDNASSDKTLQHLESYADPRIVRIDNSDNRGVAEGNNQGTVQAIADGCTHVLLINNDTEFGEDLLSSMLGSMGELGADMLIPKMMFFEPENTIWCAGGKFKKSTGYGIVHFGEGELDRGQFDQPSQIQYSPTCCMLINAAVFKKIGLMDERYFVYFDDVDFCWRALKAGITLWYSPASVLYHKVGGLTGGYLSPFSIRYCTRNKVYFILKHLDHKTRLLWLGLYQALFLARFISLLDSRAIYKMKLKAFAEGWRLYKSSEFQQ